MQCERCGQKPATVHVTHVVNGNKQESHLCQDCANEQGGFGFSLEPNFSIQDLLAGMLDLSQGASAQPKLQAVKDLKCDVCGQTYAEFAKVGQLGCPHCYEQFEEALAPLFRRIQGSEKHRGKVPGHSQETLAIRQRIRRLRQELDDCVAREAFERAAELRDEIRDLEAGLQNGEGSSE